MDPRDPANAWLEASDAEVRGLVRDLFRAACRQMRVRLVNRLGFDLPVRFVDASVVTLGEIQDRLIAEEGGAYVRFGFEPGDHEGLLALDGTLLYRMVGLMLGEDPWGEPSVYFTRSLTPADLRFAGRIVDDLLMGLSEATPATSEARVEMRELSGEARMPLNATRGTGMIEVRLAFGQPEDPAGEGIVALPAAVLGVLFPTRAPSRAERSQRGLARVLPLPVEVVAELARVRMTLSTVRTLAVGATIDLGPIGDVPVRIGDKFAFATEPGVQDGRRSVRVKRKMAEMLA